MSNQKSNNVQKNQGVKVNKPQKKKSNKDFIILIIGIIAVLFIGYNFLSGNKDKSVGSNSDISSSSSAQSTPSNSGSGEGITIIKKDITSTAKFYPYESSGIKMEVLAVKAKDGSIRTAFNTCQVCYPSGKGYYVQEGDELVCQNCGNRFKLDMVGTAKSGCNPIPIPDQYKTVSGDKIVVSKDFLDKNKALFSNWKK